METLTEMFYCLSDSHTKMEGSFERNKLRSLYSIFVYKVPNSFQKGPVN